jgi:hypothetical protein
VNHGDQEKPLVVSQIKMSAMVIAAWD